MGMYAFKGHLYRLLAGCFETQEGHIYPKDAPGKRKPGLGNHLFMGARITKEESFSGFFSSELFAFGSVALS